MTKFMYFKTKRMIIILNLVHPLNAFNPLNENSMIGEDFRSRACENLTIIRSLEKTIEDLKENIKELNGVIDNKDMEIVGWGRKVETYMMNLEEYLTYHELMR